jgi:hypothetical protein
MIPDEVTAAPQRHTPAPADQFTVDRANRALVFVRRIVSDVVADYRELTALRSEHDLLRASAASRSRLRVHDDRIGACVQRLKALAAELSAVGCMLKDCRTGLIDFPAVYHGRRVWLCWRFDEPAVAFWHELNDGFAGRQPIGDDFH